MLIDRLLSRATAPMTGRHVDGRTAIAAIRGWLSGSSRLHPCGNATLSPAGSATVEMEDRVASMVPTATSGQTALSSGIYISILLCRRESREDLMDRFVGRTAIVTGAGSGIGRAVAHRLVREGAAVIVADVSADRVAEAVAEIGGVGQGRATGVTGDVSTQADVDRIVAAAGDRIDVLANVAGIMDGFVPPHELDDETWTRVLGVNLTGPMRLTRAVLPLMMSAHKGSIVNVASEAGLRGSASGAAYTASMG